MKENKWFKIVKLMIKSGKTSRKHRFFLISAIIFTIQLIGSIIGFIFLRHRKKIKKYVCEEIREVKELVTGQETGKKFCHDSLKLYRKYLRDFFIPSESNNHHPHSLRPKALVSYVVIAFIIKLFATGFLFFVYPSPAKLAFIISSEMVELANQDRMENGLSDLKVSPELTKAALAKGEDMILRGYFSHDTPEGKKPWEWINKNSYDYVFAGENLAMDFTEGEMIQEAFMKSPSHRKNILNPKYQEIGVAVVSGKMNGHETDVLVEFFGTQRTIVAKKQEPAVAASQVAKQIPTPAPAPKIQVNASTEVASLVNQELLSGNEELSANIEPDSPSRVLGDEATPIVQGEGIILVSAPRHTANNFIDFVINVTNILLIAFAIFVFIALMLNIFIKIRIQHYHIILQSLLVIALLLSLVLTKYNFVEKIVPQLLIL